jgi:O-antigen/teichoic acid export membrane protein
MTNVAVPASRMIAVAAAIALFGAETSALALAWTLPLAVCLVVACAIVGSLLPAPRSPRGSGVWSELWRFSAPRGLAVGFAVMVNWVDVLLVGSIAGPRNAAVYAAISRLSVIGAYGLQGVGMVVAPRFSALVTAGDRHRLEHLYQVATWWTVIVSAPLYMLLLVFAPLCARIFGHGYRQGAAALAVLAVAGLVNLGTGNVMVLLLMAGKSSWTLFDAAGSLVVNLALNLLLIPHFGVTGAAIAWSVSIVGTNVVALFQLHRSLGLRPFGRGYPLACAAPAVCFGAVGISARLILGGGIEAALATVAIGSLLYPLVLFRFRGALLLGELAASMRPARAAIATS